MFVRGMNQFELLKLAALAAKWKEPPRDALDTLVLGSADVDSLDVFEQVRLGAWPWILCARMRC